MPAFQLRPETAADQEFLLRLFASTRAPEMAIVPWSDEQKRMFIDMQFRAQTLHYRTHYPDAAFEIIEIDGEPAGRQYIRREPKYIHILDLSLLDAFRGRGIGTELLNALIAEATAENKIVSLHVEKNNPAMRLYQRLGFVKVEDKEVYDYLELKPGD